MILKHSNTEVWMINHHIVFCPRYRKRILIGKVKKGLEEHLMSIAKGYGWGVLGLEVMPDHVHLFISSDTKTAPQTIVKRFKGASSRFLRQEFPRLKEKRNLWTRPYFISTAGKVSAETIMKYIQGQRGRWAR